MGDAPVFNANLTPGQWVEAPGQPEVTPAEVITTLEKLRTSGLIEAYTLDRGAIWHVSVEYRDMDGAPCSSSRYGMTVGEAMRKALQNVSASFEAGRTE